MRLLLVLTEFPPRIGGMQAHADALARHLCAEGHTVHVVTYRTSTDETGAAAYDATLPCTVERVLTRFGHFRNVDVLTERVRRLAIDLVYASTVFFGELATRTGVPVVCRSAGNDVLRPWIGYPFRTFAGLAGSRPVERLLYGAFRRLPRPELLDGLLRTQRRAVMIDAARRAHHVLANSRFTADALRDVGVAPERVSVVPGGVDAARFAPLARLPSTPRRDAGVPDDRFVVLTACRFERKKGVDLLIDVLPDLLRAVPDAHLVIVGGGRLDRRWRAQARASSAAERITFVGVVPHVEVDAWFRAADVFVLASRVHVDAGTGLRDVETMGRVLCEANAAGVPVVAARSGGIPSVIEDGVNGLLFDEDDATSLADAVTRIARDRELAHRLVDAGRRRARERFDWSVVLAEHDRCFARVLDRTAAVQDGA